MMAAAHNVRDVLAGRSLSDSLAQTPAALRASAQAIAFHVMRRLGLARELRRLLVRRTPPDPLFDALMLTALALADTAVRYVASTSAADAAVRLPGSSRAGDTATRHQRDEPAPRHVPVYAPHTVVDQAVHAADRQRGMRPYKALLNGVLRRFLRERDALLEQAARQPEARYNHPAWWVGQVRAAYPAQWEALLDAADLPGPMTLRVNARRSSVPAMQAALRDAGIAAASAGADAVVLAEARPVQAIPGFNEGWWSVQDLAAQRAGQLLPVADGMRVLDACAAPGGKTAHLLERAKLELTALDADPARLERVGENLRRLGLDGPNVHLQCADAADLAAWWDGRPFDAVLADVPCTASGVVRRHPDIRWLRREEDVPRTAALQARIVDALWQTVKPGGHLLYATCSIFPQEGEQQAEAFVRRHADAIRLPAPGQMLPLPAPGGGEPGGASDRGNHHNHDALEGSEDHRDRGHAAATPAASDGFFYALFAKKA